MTASAYLWNVVLYYFDYSFNYLMKFLLVLTKIDLLNRSHPLVQKIVETPVNSFQSLSLCYQESNPEIANRHTVDDVAVDLYILLYSILG